MVKSEGLLIKVTEQMKRLNTDVGTTNGTLQKAPAQFKIPDILKVPPISRHGDVIEISKSFGGAAQLRSAVSEMQSLLYAS